MPQHQTLRVNVSDEATLDAWAHVWAKTAQAPLWFGLQGPLGAGKTTFVRAVLRHLGITQPITSPTYPLMNTYEQPHGSPVVHADWYRLNDEAELEAIGWRDVMSEATLGFVEWPERIPHVAEALCDITCLWTHEGMQRTMLCTAHTQGGMRCLNGVKALWDVAS